MSNPHQANFRQQALAEAIKAHAHKEWTAEAIVKAAEVYYRFLNADHEASKVPSSPQVMD